MSPAPYFGDTMTFLALIVALAAAGILSIDALASLADSRREARGYHDALALASLPAWDFGVFDAPESAPAPAGLPASLFAGSPSEVLDALLAFAGARDFSDEARAYAAGLWASYSALAKPRKPSVDTSAPTAGPTPLLACERRTVVARPVVVRFYSAGRAHGAVVRRVDGREVSGLVRGLAALSDDSEREALALAALG